LSVVDLFKRFSSDVKLVLYVDESGLKSFCNCVVVAGVLAAVSGSYMYWGEGVVRRIREALGVSGELKWRVVKRRGGRRLVEELLRGLEVRHFAVHYTSQVEFEKALWRFLVEVPADFYVLDVGLADASKFPRAVNKPSHKTPGIQIADLAAGFFAEKARC
jgi:hypothetical protein